MLTRILTLTTAAFAFVAAATAQSLVLQPMTGFGPNGDGSLRAGDRDYLTTGGNNNPPHNRSIAYDPTTGNVLVVNKYGSTTLPEVHVLNGADGSDIGSLQMGSIVSGGNANFPLNAVAVADDGAIYGCNVSTTTFPPEMRLYRWADASAPQACVFPPIPVTTNGGDPSNGNPNTIHRRWGDTIAVRGSGMNTEVLVASRGTLVAIFRPTDSSMESFYSTPIDCPVTPGALGFGIAFGPGNTFYAKDSDSNLHYLGYNLASGIATNIQTFAAHQFPMTASALGVNVGSNLLATVAAVGGPDKIQLYDISTPANPPQFLDTKYFVTSNSTTIGSVVIGGGNVYALCADNGIMAFNIGSGSTALPPTIFSQPPNTIVEVSSNAVIHVGVEGSQPMTFEWYFNNNLVSGETNSSLTINDAEVADAGGYKVIIANEHGSVTSRVAIVTVSTEPIPTLLVYEPFNYPVGSYIGTNGSWFSSAATQGVIGQNSLSYSGLPASTGNQITWGSASLSARLPIGTNAVVGTYYFSFIFQAENLALSANVGQWGGFVEGTSSTVFGTKLLLRTNGGGGFNIGVAKGGGTTFSGWAPDQLSLGTPVFVVGRYTFNGTTADDTCSLWVNPDVATFGSATVPTPDVEDIGNGGADLTAIDRFFFRGGSGNAGTMRADEVRVGTTWAEVTPVPVVTTPAQMQIERSGLDVTVTWPASATGYVLESSTVVPSNSWLVIPHTTNGSNNTATISDISGNQFFRLRK